MKYQIVISNEWGNILNLSDIYDTDNGDEDINATLSRFMRHEHVLLAIGDTIKIDEDIDE